MCHIEMNVLTETTAAGIMKMSILALSFVRICRVHFYSDHIFLDFFLPPRQAHRYISLDLMRIFQVLDGAFQDHSRGSSSRHLDMEHM